MRAPVAVALRPFPTLPDPEADLAVVGVVTGAEVAVAMGVGVDTAAAAVAAANGSRLHVPGVGYDGGPWHYLPPGKSTLWVEASVAECPGQSPGKP